MLRWGLGLGYEHHLNGKSSTRKAERPQQHYTAMTPAPEKRKRAKSSQSIHRPAKRNPIVSSDVKVKKKELIRPAEDKQTVKMPIEEAQLDGMDLDRATSVAGNTKMVDPDDEIDRHARLRSAISRQFNLEILLKHNELRLIDQEIAKVQIALEQLRRCSIIPYPSMTSSAENISNVAHSNGVAEPQDIGKITASQPPLWGVVDGPYSRHYARWLLPDPLFDGGHSGPPKPSSKAGKTVPERHTRGGKEISLPMTKPRPRAGISRYQTLGAASGEHKGKKGPMILKRALDGKLVKLVCLNCHREDFNSAQGFINHCRIAHSHNLTSHEAAARECGQEVDPNKVIEMTPEINVFPTAGLPPISTGMAHPMNRTQMLPIPKLSIPRPRSITKPSTPISREVPAYPETGQTFKPSSQVPHLSRLFARLGKGVDLTAAVKDATTKENIVELSNEESVSDSDSESDEETTPIASGMARIPSRISTRGGPSPSIGMIQPESRKGPKRATRHPHVNQAKSTRITLPDPRDAHDLSPNTITSVNAPSLISDSDNASSDDEYGSVIHHESSSDCGSDDEGEALDEDDIDVDMSRDLPLRNGFGDDHASPSGADLELRASGKARTMHDRNAGGRPRAPNAAPTAGRRRRERGKGT